MNSVVLIGRLTRDPEVRYTAGKHRWLYVTFTRCDRQTGQSRTAEKTDRFSESNGFRKTGRKLREIPCERKTGRRSGKNTNRQLYQ